MTPFDDFVYLVNHVLLGDEPSIEDFILLIGTLVAFIAFILWCCFPIQPKNLNYHRQFACKSGSDASTNTVCSKSGFGLDVGVGISNSMGVGVGFSVGAAGGSVINVVPTTASSSSSNCYSKSGPMYFHHDYYKNGHHCCT